LTGENRILVKELRMLPGGQVEAGSNPANFFTVLLSTLFVGTALVIITFIATLESLLRNIRH
jgi:hypothetical protein